MVGIGGAMLGYPFLDPAAGILVAGMLSNVGFKIARDAVRELTDQNLFPGSRSAGPLACAWRPW